VTWRMNHQWPKPKKWRTMAPVVMAVPRRRRTMK
jgi:hypothetical protein